jgi:hypothetical protein
MLTASIQVGSEKIGSCTGMLGNTYMEMSSNHTHCQCGKFFTPISLLPNISHPLSALSQLFCVSNLITWSTTSSMKWTQSVKEDFSSAYTGTWCVLSLPDNAAAVYRQVMFKPTLRTRKVQSWRTVGYQGCWHHSIPQKNWTSVSWIESSRDYC